jgi:hypothetical protein
VLSRSIACVSVLAPVLVSGAARADLREVAERVAAQWRAAGAKVERGPTRFLYEDETMTVAVGAPATVDGCTSVALIGARGLSFHAKVSGTEDDPLLEDPSARASSVAGVLQIERCGAAPPIHHLIVTSDAGRGAIETVVARSTAAVPAMRLVLPERTGGALPPPPDPGPSPALPAAPKRAEQAEMRARREGAQVVPREAWPTGTDGSGEGRTTLDAGCHRIELFAPEMPPNKTGRRMRLDVDAELRDDGDELLARDRTDASDARLEACVGEAIGASVVFAGAPANAQVAATHAWWPLPERLPTAWGAEARGRMAKALHVRHAAEPTNAPIALFQGPAGTTPIALPIEPGGCYLVVAAVTHGHVRGLGVRASVGARDASDERGSEDDAGAVAFCARDQSIARLEVEARGTSVAWGLAVFRLQSAVWEVAP